MKTNLDSSERLNDLLLGFREIVLVVDSVFVENLHFHQNRSEFLSSLRSLRCSIRIIHFFAPSLQSFVEKNDVWNVTVLLVFHVVQIKSIDEFLEVLERLMQAEKRVE